ncbi:putative C2H2-type domain-containing protein [Seiridium unicorne]|uniref:C2H2-type domain-containing protein n=1 Tax=Seiridium unicorne TaxID=138068 RepID=A0ABR2UKV8_9PEZI
MADKFADKLYSLTAGELRELVLVLCMEKKAKGIAQAHMNIMRPSLGLTATSTTTSSVGLRAQTPTNTHLHLPSLTLSPESPSQHSHLDLPAPTTGAGRASKKPHKSTPRKPTKTVVKRTPLYHTCQNCHGRFRQQDNGFYACTYHTGQLVNTISDDHWRRASPRIKKYACCGKDAKAAGCRQGKHVARNENLDH